MKLKHFLSSLFLIFLVGCSGNDENFNTDYFDFYKSEKERTLLQEDLGEVALIQIVEPFQKESEDFVSIFDNDNLKEVYLDEHDYLSRIEYSNIKLVKNVERTLISTIIEDNSEQIFKTGIEKSYIQSITEVTNEKGETTTEVEVNKIDLGLTINYTTFTEGGEKFITLKFRQIELASMEKNYVNDIDYIETPNLKYSNFSATLTFNKNGYFVKELRDGRVVVISFNK